MLQDNPADRLLQILKAGKALPTDGNCREAWCTLLHTQEQADLLSRLSKVAALPDQIAVLLREELEDEEDWKHWYIQVKQAFVRQNLRENWQSFIGGIDEHAMRGLSMSNRLIKTICPNSSVDHEKLSEVRAEFQALFDQILADESLEKSLRNFLSRAIANILRSIDEYAIAGINGITEAIDALTGRMVLDVPLREAVRASGRGKQIYDLIKQLVTITAVAEKFPALIKAAGEVWDKLT